MIVINLLYISIIICYVVDISGVVDNIKKFIWKFIIGKNVEYKYFSFKPFDCSRCMIFWAGLIYLICVSQFTLFNICLVCLFSFLSIQITDIYMLINDIFYFIINKVRKLID